MESLKLHIILITALLGLMLVSPPNAAAFPAGTYAESSVLSSGKWVKISVTQSGMYLLSNADLAKMGFSNPSRVRIYGYGGKRISDHLTLANFTDDLPLVQTAVTKRGIVFYGVGAEEWNANSDGVLKYVRNPFSLRGYYYVTESDAPLRDISSEGLTSSSSGEQPATTAASAVIHEQELISPGLTGHYNVGEDFRFTQSRDFRFTLPGKVSDTDVRIECSFLTNSTLESRIILTANGTQLPQSASDVMQASATSDACGDSCLSVKTIALDGNSLNLNVRLQTAGILSGAYLDYITVNYTRTLDTDAARAGFFITRSPFTISGAQESDVVWDVTDPLDIHRMTTVAASGSLTVYPDRSGTRRYIVWNETATLPSPAIAGTVRNQNLHAQPVPDMVIVSTQALLSEAERLAELHRTDRDSLKVLVVEQSLVYNEFGSGSPDIGAVRRMLKMFYDRSGQNGERTLKYVLMMGRATFDHRKVTTQGKNLTYEVMPIWCTDTGIDLSSSYCSDDILGFLADDSGLRFGSDKLCIAPGRIPATSVQEARTYVDRATKYLRSPMPGQWRNHVMTLADDRDKAEHAVQADSTVSKMLSYDSGKGLMHTKIFIDGFEFVGDRYPDARDKMFQTLNNGVIWWTYIGHGGEQALTADNQLMRSDLFSLYLRHAPVFYAATCSFGRWDGSMQCGIEALTMNESGGAIAAISATRPVYISLNGVLSANVGLEAFRRDESGRFRTVGEILMRAKNRMETDLNKRRYVLAGDPAIRLMVPENRVVLESVDGVAVNEANQVTIAALQRPVLRGYVAAPDGSRLPAFNGTLSLTLYDAEHSSNTNGRKEQDNTPGTVITYEQQGDRLMAGSGEVKNGEFEITVNMPSEIAGNFRPAALNMYAVANDGTEACGINRDFYVYGFCADAETDTVPPVIEAIALNHESFVSGGEVNSTPTLIVKMSDNVGINLSNAGIGHQMAVSVDGKSDYTDVASYFTPAADGSPAGSLLFPLGEIAKGDHTLTFRVWDTSANSATASLDFRVVEGLAPVIFNVYTDANPASVEANFYVSHNRPDAMLKVKVEIFDISGRLVWEQSTDGRADQFTSSPVCWNLTDRAGHRVGRGIYIYRVTVSDAGGAESSQTKRIAVTGA